MGISQAFRLGQKNARRNKPRLLKVKLIYEEQKGQLLRGSKRFRSLDTAEYPIESYLYITPDHTLKQREENKKLREELERKRNETGSRDWIIKNGKIVRRQPPIAPVEEKV